MHVELRKYTTKRNFVNQYSMYGLQKSGPIEDYALADLYTWLESPSGLSHSYVTTTSTIGANTSSSSKR